jgi:transposase
VIVDRTRALEVLIGLPDVEFVGLDDSDAVLRIVIEQRVERPSCPACAMAATVKERHEVELVDLPAFGRPTRIVWRKHRWSCPSGACTVGSWTGQDPRIAPARAVMTDRCARWCVREVGELGRPVNDVARMLGCDWHTVNDSVIRYGEALLDADTERIGPTRALGLDETLFVRRGPFRAQCWSTQIVDVEHGVLLDVVEGRSADEACRWLMFRDLEWLGGIDFGTLDLSSTYRKVFETMLPWVTLIADPFHVVRIATHRLDEVRRRVQNETVGHRGRKTDPLYRARRLLTRAHERLSDDAHAKCAMPGMPRKSSARSTTSPMPTSRISS